MDDASVDKFILTNMPHFIAINYQRMLDAETSEERVRLILHTYNLGLRALTINLVSQYLILDRDRVNDPHLNDLLWRKFPYLTLDAWPQLFFATLRAYEGHRQLLFMPELYDFYWDTTSLRHHHRPDVEHPFERLTQVATEVLTPQRPRDEASWGRLAEETLGLVRQILRSFSFIGRYDLIRVLDYDDQVYDFELHKGTTIVRERQRRPAHVEFNRGWFYLRARSDDFLRLYPLLVFWEPEPTGSEVVQADTGVYDRFVYERLRYLLATRGNPVEDDKDVAAFVALLYDTIEEVKRKRREAEKLTWWQLCEICTEITQQRMETVRGKYRAELYLQRDKTRQAFERFLESDKRCFVLIGKSGVGKSNFFLSLGEQLRQARSDDICVLMYDGAQINAAQSITDVINQDFADRLLLTGRQVEHIWREIAQLDGIEERRVVLFVDAINENPRASDLLRQLDEIARTWPWLKVIFSSRPETWRSIKRVVKLTEGLYYREEGAEGVGVELEPFSYSEQMDPFTRQELPTVYARYQQVFKLQTSYASLPHTLRDMLSDPFNLWLVAKTHEEAAIPSNLKTTKLIEGYLDAMKGSKRLDEEDLRLLEKQLMPLMLREYNNEITIADIDAADEGLYELLKNQQMLSDGRRMNQSFTNLLDSDILVHQEQGHEQKITFKYERFYEYFAGHRIHELSKDQVDQMAFFTVLVGKISEKPFLWGAIKFALILVAQDGGVDTISKLCLTTEQRVKELMVKVLVEFGIDDAEKTEEILSKLIPVVKKIGSIQQVWQLLDKSETKLESSSQYAGKIAVEVAGSLCIPSILKAAAEQMDSTIRTWAVRYIYYLWQHDQDMGYKILKDLSTDTTRSIIPNLTTFESVLGLSLIIFFEKPEDENVIMQLQNIWRDITAKILGIKEESTFLGKMSREFIRERIISFFVYIIFKLFKELPDYNIINQQGIEEFFRLSKKQKETYINLVRYIDVNNNYFMEDMRADYLEFIKTKKNILYIAAALMGLIAHSCQHPSTFLPFLKDLFEEAENDTTPNPYLTDLTQVLANILDRNPYLDEVFNFFVYTVEICQNYYSKYPYLLNNEVSKAPKASYIGPYILYQYQREGTIRTSWLETRLQTALSQGNKDFFDILLKTELPLVGIEHQKPLIALDALSLIFDTDNKAISEMIQMFLSRLRVHYPDEVDDFLEDKQTSNNYRLQIQTNEPEETIGQLIGLRSWYFLRDEIIIKSPHLRARIMQILSKAADCQNMKEWLNYFIREIINALYGEEILLHKG